jgi:uncharacterized membrane protein (DUF106 family)
VDLFNSLMRGIVGGFGGLFGALHPLISLTLISVITGIGMLWVFARTSNQKKIERTKKRLQAYLLELRLFGDDLSLVWKSQKNLLTGNLRYMALMLQPALFLTIPVVVLMIHMDAFYGWTPLPVGESAVITVQTDEMLTSSTAAPTLEAPPGIVVETPPVRALRAGQFSWRIRAEQPVDGVLAFEWNGARFEKSIAAGTPWRYLSLRRVRSTWDALWNPGEDRLNAPSIQWVEAPYPPATIGLAGIELHWMIWFLLISVITAYLLKGYFHVVI